MSRRPGGQGRAPEKARAPQHIASIAHLFFDNEEKDEVKPERNQPRHLLVIGNGREAFAPYTAAGLGQHLLDQSAGLGGQDGSCTDTALRQVYLAEPSPVCFSAYSQLDENTYRAVRPDEPVPWADRSGRRPGVRLFSGPVPGEDFSGGLTDGFFTIRHLDLPGELELQALETQVALGSGTPLGIDGRDGLVWCVGTETCCGMTQSSRLGRLMALIQPRVVQLLVFAGKSRIQHQEEREALLQQGLKLLQFVSREVPVHGRWVGTSVAERNQVLGALARSFSL